MKERIQKIIANAGFCSRRKAEDYIKKGRVVVNTHIAEIGESADISKDTIIVNGHKINASKKVYYMLNKPKNVESTLNSTSGKRTVIDLINTHERIIPVGRLDAETRGLILLTNDGDFANKVMHPRYEKEKTYKVTVNESIDPNKLNELSKGTTIGKQKFYPCNIKILKRTKDKTLLLIKLKEGKKRQIRKMLSSVGHKVTDLIRIRIGPLSLGTLREGQYRELTKDEVRDLIKQDKSKIKKKGLSKKKKLRKLQRK